MAGTELRRVSKLGRLSLAVAAVTALRAENTHAAVSYTLADFGILSQANAINDNGQVTGAAYFTTGSTWHAFLYANGTMKDIGPSNGNSRGASINASGEIVGSFYSQGGANGLLFVYDNNAGTVSFPFGTVGGSQLPAGAVNNSGTIATTLPPSRGVVIQDGHWTSLPGRLGGPTSYSIQNAINNIGQIAGYLYTQAGFTHAFIYTNGQFSDLGTLGGSTSTATAINDSGVAVGGANTASNVLHPFVYTSAGMTDLGTLGLTSGQAQSINNNGQVVGYVQTNSNNQHAFVYSGGTMLDMATITPSSGWTALSVANGINNKGQIVGYGTHNGVQRAFLYTLNSTNWTNAVGGAWYAPSNWDTSSVGVATADTTFALNSSYTINLSADAAAKSLSVTAGHVTLDLTGHALAVGGALQISSGATVNLTGGTLGVGSITAPAFSRLNWTAGTLAINGTGSSFGGTLTVPAGATLGGSGVITDAVLVPAGAHLAPGNSPGTLNLANTTLSTGSNFDVELAGASSGQFDSINVTGTVDITGANLNLSLLNSYNPPDGTGFLVINNDGTDPITGHFANVTDSGLGWDYLITSGRAFEIYYNSGDGNDVVVVAVPEPVGAMLLLPAAVGLLARRRKRQICHE